LAGGRTYIRNLLALWPSTLIANHKLFKIKSLLREATGPINRATWPAGPEAEFIGTPYLIPLGFPFRTVSSAGLYSAAHCPRALAVDPRWFQPAP
jgi:hypothetical protein